MRKPNDWTNLTFRPFSGGEGICQNELKKKEILLIIEIILIFEINNQNMTWLYFV